MDFLPMPHSVAYGEGSFPMDYRTCVSLVDTKPSSLIYAEMVRDAIRQETGLSLAIRRGPSRAREIVLQEDTTLPADHYRLSVTQAGVFLRGGSDEAVCHGAQTLCQWVARHGSELPALEIEDYPDFPNRGYYLDVSRGRVPTLQTLKAYADLLCRYKINEWQLYVEHTYLFHDFSEAWRDDTPLTAEEIMELDLYCKARYIELVPSLSTFGHMYKILSTKTYCDYCELEDSEKVPFAFTRTWNHHTLNVSNEKSLELVKGMISEYMQLFSSRKFNICADETFDLGKGRSRRLVEEQGEHTLYLRHVQALCEWLVEQGYTPMFWGDIIGKYPHVYQMLPKETICLNWGYSPTQPEDEIRVLAGAGATQYACPGVSTWNRWLPLLRDSFDNNRAMCGHGRKYAAIGLLNTDWGDFAHTCHPWFSVPGILYGAAFAWNADEQDFDDVNRAISLLEYGDPTGRFMDAFAALTDHEAFEWETAVRWIEAADGETRREIFTRVDISQIRRANEDIQSALERLRSAARTMSPDKRSVLHALNLVADGVRIWNEIGGYISQTVYGREMDAASGETRGGEVRSGEILAEELEKWYYAYTRLWRGVSKEGGLPKLTKLIADYADFLRGREYFSR